MRVKSFPALNLACLRHRKDKPYRLWLIMRALKPYGIITERELWQAVKDMFTKRTMMNTLRQGDGVFWHRVRGIIYYHSLLKVADALDVDLCQHPVYIDIPTGLAEYRRLLVESYFANKPRTIALATMAELTGRTKQTAIKYLRGCDKTTNLMLSNRSSQDHVIPELAARGYYRTIINGQSVLVKRMPNTYSNDHETAAFGLVKHQAPFLLATKALRRYFDKAKTARKAIIDERTIYTPWGRERKQIIWHGWTRAFGDITAV